MCKNIGYQETSSQPGRKNLIDFLAAEDPESRFPNLGSLEHNEGRIICINDHRHLSFLALRAK